MSTRPVSRKPPQARYLAITPARDEERLLPGLIASLEAQSATPAHWILIDDGSRDGTPAIADAAAARCPWIEVHHLDLRRERAPGGESVIMKFLPRELWQAYDFILRLDADLTFGSKMRRSDLLVPRISNQAYPDLLLQPAKLNEPGSPVVLSSANGTWSAPGPLPDALISDVPLNTQ